MKVKMMMKGVIRTHDSRSRYKYLSFFDWSSRGQRAVR
jgi:hypothetical protein